MEKVLVRICVPALQLEYDAFMPLDLMISRLTSIIAEGVGELTDGKYERSGQELLSLKEPEALLDPALTLNDYNVKDGAQFILL